MSFSQLNAQLIENRNQMEYHEIKTKHGYKLLDVTSALQKAIRRADVTLAGYWAIELWESGYRDYLWRRLLTISAEDCWGLITYEIEALFRGYQFIVKKKKHGGRVFASKAVILLAMCQKCRDADHLTNLVYDKDKIDYETLHRDISEARKNPLPIPDYAYDCHTKRGRIEGRTKEEFFIDEHYNLKPRQPGLFDDYVKES